MSDCPIWPETPAATVIERAVPFACTTDVALGSGFPSPEKRCEFYPRALTNHAANWHLHDATIVPSKSLVFKDGQIVGQTRYGLRAEEAAAAWECLAAPRRAAA